MQCKLCKVNSRGAAGTMSDPGTSVGAMDEPHIKKWHLIAAAYGFIISAFQVPIISHLLTAILNDTNTSQK